MTLIKAARTMLADSQLPISFWVEAFSRACYVQNSVLVVKPHNKTLCELLRGKTPTLCFMRPFGCPVTILNTIDHLGKFDGNVDEGTQSKGFAGTKASDNADPKSSHDDGSKPSSDDGKKVDEYPRKETECKDQEKEDNVNCTNNHNTAGNVNTVSLIVNAAGTNKVNVVCGKISIELPFDPKLPTLEDDSVFDFSSDDEDDSAVADMNNLDTTIQEEPKKVIHVLKDPSWIKAMNKKDERRIVIRNKARLVAQGYTQEERINYDEVFAPVARIEAIRLFLAYASFKDFVVYKMDVKSAFLYGKIEEEVYVYQPPKFEDTDFPNRVYKVEKALYGLNQALRAWSYALHLRELKTSSTPMETQKPMLKDEDGEEVDVHMYRYQVNLKVSHPHAMKRIFRYLKGQLKLGLCYPKDSPFDLVA
nr:hypothetical protein [Tanacetum cinerariifolium]